MKRPPDSPDACPRPERHSCDRIPQAPCHSDCSNVPAFNSFASPGAITSVGCHSQRVLPSGAFYRLGVKVALSGWGIRWTLLSWPMLAVAQQLWGGGVFRRTIKFHPTLIGVGVL